MKMRRLVSAYAAVRACALVCPVLNQDPMIQAPTAMVQEIGEVIGILPDVFQSSSSARRGISGRLRNCIKSFPCPERQGFGSASARLRGRGFSEFFAREGGELLF